MHTHKVPREREIVPFFYFKKRREQVYITPELHK